MTRPLSVSQMKMNSKQLHRQPTGKLGEVYRMLLTHRGKPVAGRLLSTIYPKWAARTLTQLRDFYGLDIRRLPSGEWLLAGYTDSRSKYISFETKTKP